MDIPYNMMPDEIPPNNTYFNDASLERFTFFVNPARMYEDRLTSSIERYIINKFAAPAMRNIPRVSAQIKLKYSL